MVAEYLEPEEYLAEPYGRLLVPDRETGTFTAMIPELPGCISQGATPGEAYERLERAAVSWLEAAIDLGQRIPDPNTEQGVKEYSGRFALRLPKSLHRRVARLAEADGTSLNQFILVALAEKVGAVAGPVERRKHDRGSKGRNTIVLDEDR